MIHIDINDNMININNENVNDNINTGDLTKKVGSAASIQSHYGVWGAMGSKAGGEAIRE